MPKTIVKEIDLPKHMYDIMWESDFESRELSDIMMKMLEIVSRQKRQFWDEGAKLLGFENIRELETSGHSIVISRLRDKIRLEKDNEVVDNS